MAARHYPLTAPVPLCVCERERHSLHRFSLTTFSRKNKCSCTTDAVGLPSGLCMLTLAQAPRTKLNLSVGDGEKSPAYMSLIWLLCWFSLRGVRWRSFLLECSWFSTLETFSQLELCAAYKALHDNISQNVDHAVYPTLKTDILFICIYV